VTNLTLSGLGALQYNSIDFLWIGDSISSDPAKISEHVVQFYQDLFSKKHSWRPRLDDLSFDAILESESSWLERAFEEEEVRNVVFAMKGDKAPGPDGFTMAFFQDCWEVVRLDIMEVFSDFHAREVFENSLNVSFITLIPKIPGAISLSMTFGP
jgi:hypothetical protein